MGNLDKLKNDLAKGKLPRENHLKDLDYDASRLQNGLKSLKPVGDKVLVVPKGGTKLGNSSIFNN